MSNDRDITLYDLKERTRNEVRDLVQELSESAYPRDDLHEIADSNVPIYNYDLLSVAQSDLWLAVAEPEVFAFGGEHTAVAAIAGNIYQELIETAHEAWQEIQNEPESAPA